MSTKFFNNTHGNTLFEKLKGIANNMKSFDRFLAVVGFFRSSGYFKLRKELGDIPEIKILVGINIDNIFRKHNKALLMLADSDKAKELYNQDFLEDIHNAHYSKEVEEGILQMIEDIREKRLEMRICATQNLHAKFYLCLPKEHTEHSDGWVIMGSSNISDSGLGIKQPPQYELNVAMKDYDDVKYCAEEFENLWEGAVPISLEDIENSKKQTYLGSQPTPYEVYIKVLIDTFGDQVEDDFTIQLPDGVKELKYQKDAVIQGYQMLLQHNGLFLADVVGLGKTMIATMIAKRFIEANGRTTTILVVYPPALEDNWKNTFKQFNIDKKAQFITNGSLSKIIEGKDNYKDKEEFDLIIVDEAHGFRSDTSGRYDELQRICKSPRKNSGLIRSATKKVMLLSATPLNNRPDDLLNQLLLFQNSQNCTIDGIPNLRNFFAPLIADYNRLMSERNKQKEIASQQDNTKFTKRVDKIYEDIRNRVLDKVTIRRTRNNIINDADYRKDIKEQGIVFPHILPPQSLIYEMDSDTSKRFYDTLNSIGRRYENITKSEESDSAEIITEKDAEGLPLNILTYARYRAVEFLKPDIRKKYKNAEIIGKSLSDIYRIHMVKRLESSFYAFKKSLQNLLDITNGMIKMFNEDKVIIAPDLQLNYLQKDRGMEIDEIIEYAIKKDYVKENILYPKEAFEDVFIKMLHHDREILERLNADWAKEHDDPKFDLFNEKLQSTFLSEEINPTRKLVVFSESVDTLNYLYKKLTHDKKDVLCITSLNRNKYKEDIKRNFDANSKEQDNQYNIILTSDVLAEGVNLHRANVIINYDSPWNASRLMQRIGRVNRIGSVASEIHNFMFYPSQEGDNEIQLYKNALIKLQGFHSAFGEDAQIYSQEEIVRQFEMFDNRVKDSVDKKIALLREVRDLYHNNRALYHKIKNLPPKCRVGRASEKHSGKSVVFITSNVKTEYYLVEDKKVEIIDFLKAVEYLKAKPEEKAVAFPPDTAHYKHTLNALQKYTQDYVEAADDTSIKSKDLDKTSQIAKKFLRTVMQVSSDMELKRHCKTLESYIDEGIYNKLAANLKPMAAEFKNDRAKIKESEYALQAKLRTLVNEYKTTNKEERHDAMDIDNPQIVISETFI